MCGRSLEQVWSSAVWRGERPLRLLFKRGRCVWESGQYEQEKCVLKARLLSGAAWQRKRSLRETVLQLDFSATKTDIWTPTSHMFYLTVIPNIRLPFFPLSYPSTKYLSLSLPFSLSSSPSPFPSSLLSGARLASTGLSSALLSRPIRNCRLSPLWINNGSPIFPNSLSMCFMRF